MSEFLKMIKLTNDVVRIVKAAKFIYGENWEQKKKETLEVIDAYKIASNKETRLATAIEMASLVGDQKAIMLLIAAAADDEQEEKICKVTKKKCGYVCVMTDCFLEDENRNSVDADERSVARNDK